MDPRPDADRPDTEPDGYVELGVLKNKGARSDVHRRLLLPIVAPLISLSGAKWWESWQEARMALGLGTSGLLDKPVMCRFDADGCAVDQGSGSKLLPSLASLYKVIMNQHIRWWICSLQCLKSVLPGTFLFLSASAGNRSFKL